MTNAELLKALSVRRLLDPAVADQIDREVRSSGRVAEDIIRDRRLIPDDELAKTKADILGIPYVPVDLASYDDSLITVIPEETARTYGVIPLRRDAGTLVVGMLHPDDGKAQDALRFIAQTNRLDLGVYLISYGDWEAVLRKYAPYRSTVEAAVRSLNIGQGSGNVRHVASLEDAMKGSDEAPVIKIVADTLREAVERGASDVHIEPQEKSLRVRLRINGDLEEVASLPSELAQPVVSRVKVVSNLKIDETRVPQDGRFRATLLDREVDFRVATFPTPLGEKVAIRVLDPTQGVRRYSDLGLEGKNDTLLREGIGKPYGMILVTGPTGSGKTTTLYALLGELNKESVNIVSLEDPVEYFVPGMNQSQVRPEIGYDFASGLRQILRQDPDVIMVGEIRDRETAALAVQAALTGHIVLSTLHTNNAVGVIPRLLDMGVEPFLLPAALNIMMSQRLLGKLCEQCKKKEPASPALQKVIHDALSEHPAEIQKEFAAPYLIYHAPGCDACHGKGVSGRLAIHEVLSMTPGIERVIAGGPTLQKLAAEGKSQGMISLRGDGVLKALRGLVGMEEVIRTTEAGEEESVVS